MYEILSHIDILCQEELSSYDLIIRNTYKSYYYTPKCGEKLYAALRTDFTPLKESQIVPFRYHAENMEMLKSCFLNTILSMVNNLLNKKASPSRDNQIERLRSALIKVSFWEEVPPLIQKLKAL